MSSETSRLRPMFDMILKSIPAKWQGLLILFIAIKTAYLAIVSVAVVGFADFEEARALIIRQNWFSDSWEGIERGTFERHFATWDAEHYLYLSEFGYGKDVRSCAFYPFWPLLVRCVSGMTNSHLVLAGMILANIASALGWVLFYQIVHQRFGATIARWSLVFTIAFPGSLFFQFIYSESLFFLFLMGLWWGLENRRYGVTAAAAFLLPLTRGVGVFGVIPLGWYWLLLLPQKYLPNWEWLSAERHRIASVDTGKPKNRSCWRFLLVLMPMAGWGAYLCLMWMWTGNPFEGMQAQKYWQHTHSIQNLWDIPEFVTGFFDPTSFHFLRGSVLDRIGFLVLLMCLPVIWRQGKDMIAWTYILGIVPAMSGTFASFIRFESMVFPLFIALASLLVGQKQAASRWICLLIFAVMHGVLLWRFVNYRWAG